MHYCRVLVGSPVLGRNITFRNRLIITNPSYIMVPSSMIYILKTLDLLVGVNYQHEVTDLDRCVGRVNDFQKRWIEPPSDTGETFISIATHDRETVVLG